MQQGIKSNPQLVQKLRATFLKVKFSCINICAKRFPGIDITVVIQLYAYRYCLTLETL